jgi:hypothetical protein
VRHVTSQSQKPRPEAPEPNPASARPALRVIQGGVTRRRRLEKPGAPRPASDPVAEVEEEAPLGLEEMTIYLRAIPAWLPRLW